MHQMKLHKETLACHSVYSRSQFYQPQFFCHYEKSQVCIPLEQATPSARRSKGGTYPKVCLSKSFGLPALHTMESSMLFIMACRGIMIKTFMEIRMLKVAASVNWPRNFDSLDKIFDVTGR